MIFKLYYIIAFLIPKFLSFKKIYNFNSSKSQYFGWPIQPGKMISLLSTAQ